MDNETNIQNEEQTGRLQQPAVTGWFGRILCKTGLHSWQEGYTNSTMTPIAHKCRRCRLVRVFRMWGYTYHRDVADVADEGGQTCQ